MPLSKLTYITCVITQDEKSDLNYICNSVSKCIEYECNKFALLQIHVKMFQPMSVTDIPTLLICLRVSRKLERSPCLQIFVKFSVFPEIFEKHAVCYDC